MEPNRAFQGAVSGPKATQQQSARQSKRCLEDPILVLHADQIFGVLDDDPKRDPVVLTEMHQVFENFIDVHVVVQRRWHSGVDNVFLESWTR